MKRSGFADLPLHGGRVPPWLAERMTVLGTAISESVIRHYGVSQFLSRLSDPFWFQALGCVMGMDWHSSGITTSVLGALKRGLNPRVNELGVYVCGGRGKHSRNTPQELAAYSERKGLPGDSLIRASRLTAKIDNNAIADGFQLYLHSFVVSSSGEWAVVQQGMNPSQRLARRYHWHSAAVREFTCEPHTFALGGKDGHPFPVPLKTYDESLLVLRRGLDDAKVPGNVKSDALKRLARFARTIETHSKPEADFHAVLAHEHAISSSLDGRTVFDDARRKNTSLAAKQGSLF